MWEEGTGSGFDQVAPADRLSRPLLPAPSVKGRQSRQPGDAAAPGGCQGPAGEGDWADRGAIVTPSIAGRTRAAIETTPIVPATSIGSTSS
jgi:hypothetical protein